jgi:NDP-sugar pyrophosphorylase family protein
MGKAWGKGMALRTGNYIAGWAASVFGASQDPPWVTTTRAAQLLHSATARLGADYRAVGEVLVHATAEIEPGAQIKGTAIIGPKCFVSRSALLRGGIYLGEGCIVGPGVELKTTFMFHGSKVAHLSFVGDSLIGEDVNIEAGAMLANYRNELADKRIRLCVDGAVIDTGVDKFGALVGDGARIGANAVLAPGTVLAPGARVGRLELVDQRAQG